MTILIGLTLGLATGQLYAHGYYAAAMVGAFIIGMWVVWPEQED